jgi:uncharacterized repeat protein (TIGR01451 family)
MGSQNVAAAPTAELAAVGPAAPQAIGPGFTVNFNANTDDATFQGYSVWVDYNPAVLAGDLWTQLKPANMNICAGTSIDNGLGNAQDNGCAALNPVGAFTGTVSTLGMHCVAPGVSPLDLRSLGEVGAFGSSLFAGGGAAIPTTLIDGSVTCQYQADLYIISTHLPEPVVAGETFVKTVTVINKGPNPAWAVSVTDSFDEGKVYLEDTAPWPGIMGPYGCYLLPPAIAPNTLGCPITNPLNPMDTLDPGEVVVFTITFGVELSDAGKVNLNNVIVQSINPTTMLPVTKDPNQHPQPILTEADFLQCLMSRLGSGNPIDPPPAFCNNVWSDTINVEPASVAITKTGPGVVLMGAAFDPAYTIEIHSAGPSPATDVVVTDDLPAGVTFDGVSASCDTVAIDCVHDGSPAGGLVTCTVADPMPVSETCTITIDVTCGAAGEVKNQAEVCWADPLCAQSNEVKTIQLPPYNGMVKDARPDVDGIQDAVNLWLCNRGPDCHVADPDTGAQIGKGILDVADLIFLRSDEDSPNDTDLLPEGLAAYEEQLKYDHKIFDLVVADAGFDGLDNDGDGTIDNVGESVLDLRGRANIHCEMTIMTENWIMFGCVTAGQALGDPMPVGKWLKTIRVTPDPDMFLRLRPTKDNGVVSTLIDENCEVADIYASEPWPFTLPGGLTEDCTDLTVTVRMLEGDVNLDCEVNVLDMMSVAGRYGSSFGLLLYDKFYDLEPKLTDFDIDIKDVQFVFGRDGSKCQAPIPNQPPELPAP